MTLEAPTASCRSTFASTSIVVRAFLSSVWVALDQLSAIGTQPPLTALSTIPVLDVTLTEAETLVSQWRVAYGVGEASELASALQAGVVLAEGHNILPQLRPWVLGCLQTALSKEIARVNRYSPSKPDLLLLPAPYLTYGEGATLLMACEDPKMQSLGYWGFSRRLGETDSAIFPTGVSRTLRAACTEALHLHIGNAHAFNGLAFSIPLNSNESVVLPDGRAMTAMELYTEACKLDRDYCHPYYNLGGEWVCGPVYVWVCGPVSVWGGVCKGIVCVFIMYHVEVYDTKYERTFSPLMPRVYQ